MAGAAYRSIFTSDDFLRGGRCGFNPAWRDGVYCDFFAGNLESEAASKTTIPALLQSAGIHGFEKRRMHEIAALAKPEELDAEVREKLDMICRAFGVNPAA